MLPATIKFNDNSQNLSDQNNTRFMDDFINDLEAGTSYNPPRHCNKKMKTRKQLDALLKSRSSTSTSNRRSSRLSNELPLSSEDDVFLSNRKKSSKKIYPTRYRHWCNYTRHLLSFFLVCIFMIVCVGLAYANIELKTEVQNLSLRVNEIEKRFSNFEINRILSTIEQIKVRLNLIERWNVSFVYDRLQKLQRDFNQVKHNRPETEMLMNDDNDVDISSKLENIEQKSAQFSEAADELDKLSRDADNQALDVVHDKTKPFDRNLIERLLEQERRTNTQKDSNQLSKNLLSLNESLYENTIKWHNELKALRNELGNLNQSVKIQELVVNFQELTNLVHNSSDKVTIIITALQSDLNILRNQIDSCTCPKESLRLKPSIVDGNQLQQNIITKPNPVDTSLSPSTTTSTTTTYRELKPSEKNYHNNTVDIAQIVNQPSSVTN
ncbi:unnamed protein product [Rotaria magnacalcarata]|uniref:Uncharacterized protein n=2 Tax=Rotaria magnacalcarata TaxID=392030 RepID=A0A816M270_9BILA|nr:unnamed protein product [Rotaria magnacalcarata]CAF3743320.1 unnamed protein product [Rotaria magnacalcarata]